MARRESAARRYAEAAFEVATRDDAIEAWRSGLDAVAARIGEDRVTRVLRNPAIPLDQRSVALAGLLDGFADAGLSNMIQLLLKRGRIDELTRVASEFRRLDDRRQGLTHATVTSATPLTPDEIRALTARLEQSTGGQIALETAVDEGLLGGLVVRVGDRLIDGSVRGRLERLRNQLTSGAL